MLDRRQSLASVEAGYFGKESVVARIWRESVVMPGGVPRMLLMEAAHPLVAVAISSHSGYRERPWQRLASTLSAYATLIFGTQSDADRVAAEIRSRHSMIRGRIDRRMGKYPAGTAYAADDPELLLWVHAACVDTALVMYTTFVRRLSNRLQEAFYDEMKLVAAMLGIPGSLLPHNLAAFNRYLSSRLASDVYVVEEAREIAEVVLDPPVPAALRPLRATLRYLTSATLPPEIRVPYGLESGRASQALVAVAAIPVRRLLMPLLPPSARHLWKKRSPGPAGISFELITALAEANVSTRHFR